MVNIKILIVNIVIILYRVILYNMIIYYYLYITLFIHRYRYRERLLYYVKPSILYKILFYFFLIWYKASILRFVFFSSTINGSYLPAKFYYCCWLHINSSSLDSFLLVVLLPTTSSVRTVQPNISLFFSSSSLLSFLFMHQLGH